MPSDLMEEWYETFSKQVLSQTEQWIVDSLPPDYVGIHPLTLAKRMRRDIYPNGDEVYYVDNVPFLRMEPAEYKQSNDYPDHVCKLTYTRKMHRLTTPEKTP